MWSSLVEYHRPATLDQCLRLLSQQTPHAVPLAGGTWLVAQRNPRVDAVVDLTKLNLAFIKQSARRIRLGAMTTLQAITESPTIQGLAQGLLRETSYNSASRANRNIATLGGTIVVGSPFSEVCLALLVLDAQIVIRSPKERTVPIDIFLINPSTILSQGSIITEIYISRPTSKIGAGYAMISHTPHSQPIVNAAALVSKVGHGFRLARLALGGVTERPIRLSKVEGMIIYQKNEATLCERIEEKLRNSINLPFAEYQREMVSVVVTRALQKASECCGSE